MKQEYRLPSNRLLLGTSCRASRLTVGFRAGGPHPDPACLFHWVTEIDGGGWRVIDVWETREQAQEFIQGRVGPVMQEMGASQPQINFIDVANFLTAGQRVPAHAG